MKEVEKEFSSNKGRLLFQEATISGGPTKSTTTTTTRDYHHFVKNKN